VMVDDTTFTSCTDRLSMMCLDPSHRMFVFLKTVSLNGRIPAQAGLQKRLLGIVVAGVRWNTALDRLKPMHWT